MFLENKKKMEDADADADADLLLDEYYFLNQKKWKTK